MALSPASRYGSPSPVDGVTVGSSARTSGCGVAPVYSSTLSARSTPVPVRPSTPAGARSSAVALNASRRSASVELGLPESTSAAMPAACGAAAEVPKNGSKSSTDVVTPSAAVMSGFCRVTGAG